MSVKKAEMSADIQEMFKAGAHFAFSKARRHPTFKKVIFGAKNGTEIIDLEKTEEMLKKVEEFIASLPKEKRLALFVTSKSEAKDIVRNAAERAGLPFVSGRWIGGTLTNFEQTKKRVSKLEDLNQKRAKNELTKYTKKERLLIDREIENLEKNFGGLRSLNRLPDLLFVIDSKKEDIAVTEAKKMNIPVIALASSDCDLSKVNYAIAANDTARASVAFFTDKIVNALK